MSLSDPPPPPRNIVSGTDDKYNLTTTNRLILSAPSIVLCKTQDKKIFIRQ